MHVACLEVCVGSPRQKLPLNNHLSQHEHISFSQSLMACTVTSAAVWHTRMYGRVPRTSKMLQPWRTSCWQVSVQHGTRKHKTHRYGMHLHTSEFHLPCECLHSSQISNPSILIKCVTRVPTRHCPHCNAMPLAILLEFIVQSVISMHIFPFNVQQISALAFHLYRSIHKSQLTVPSTKHHFGAEQHEPVSCTP